MSLLQQDDTEEDLRRTDLLLDFLKCGITNNLDGTGDDVVYNVPEDTKELDDSFIRELFQSD